jgi:hypothetical protein
MSTPFEDKRRTNSMDVRRANIYKRISEVYDQLPDEFLPKELYLFTGIKNVFANRILVASVLVDSFGCTIVGDYTPRRRWKKPAAIRARGNT